VIDRSKIRNDFVPASTTKRRTLCVAGPGFSAGFDYRFLDFRDAQPSAVRLAFEDSAQIPERTFWVRGSQLSPAVRQQTQLNLLAGLDAKVLQHLFPKRYLAPLSNR
jgi:hypothetical protein